MKTRYMSLLVFFSFLAIWGAARPVQAGSQDLSLVYAPIVLVRPASAPVLKWQYKGCYSSWCETGWYSSPAAADLDGNGTVEVIGGQYSYTILNGPAL
jgi:hypothetical protein